jgi:hypothetical protein
MKENGWIGVDLDGTLAHYDGWKGVGVIGDPVPLMAARVTRWLEEGRDVRILTARVAGDDAELEEAAIVDWCRHNLGAELPVTCCKDFLMEECWDDRAVQVVPNTGLRADGVVDAPPEPGDIGAAME